MNTFKPKKPLIAAILLCAITAFTLLSMESRGATTQGSLCEETVGETATSTVPIAFGARFASPYKLKFDTYYRPSGVPLKVKGYFYASAGEYDIKAAGNLVASWVAAEAYPGNTLTVRIEANGIQGDSRWESDGGLRFGARYMYNVKLGLGKRYKKEDYVPGIPNFDISWPCETTFTPFQLGSGTWEEVCTHYWNRGNLLCFLQLKLPGTSLPTACVEDQAWSPSVDFNQCLDGEPNTSGMEEDNDFVAEFKTNPAVKLALGAKLGTCSVLTLNGDKIVDKESHQQITSDNGFIEIDVEIPCSFATATDGERVFHFTQGPFQYDGNLEFRLVGKVEPVIKPCFAKLLEVSLSIGAAVCAQIMPNPGLSVSWPIEFSEMDATFSIPVTPPEVCNISPSSGQVCYLTNTEVTWNTSWGAPDECGCKVRLYYRYRPSAHPEWAWTIWMPIDPQDNSHDNTGSYNWFVTSPPAWMDVQILVRLYDPNGDFLAEASGGTFKTVLAPCSMEGDPGFFVPFSAGVEYIARGETWCADIAPANFGFVSPACGSDDTFCIHLDDALGWPVTLSGIANDECFLQPSGTYQWVEACITAPCDVTAGETDTLTATVGFCNVTGLCAPSCGDCVDPNMSGGNPYYSTTTKVFEVVASIPSVTILQDSIYLIEQGQTMAYVPFGICNPDPCAVEGNYGYNITSKGYIGSAINHSGTLNALPGGECEDVYGIIDASLDPICTFDTMTIIAWTTGGTIVYDTCVQVIHVIEPTTVPISIVAVAVLMALVLIFIARRFMKSSQPG